jgi:glutathione S-transferase
MITLYELAGAEATRRFSPYCWRIRMSLRHKGLAFEGVPWRFVEKDRLAPAGAKLVPVIRDGDTWVHDSMAIAEYLEERYPDRPSLFGSAHGAALARFVAAWTDRTVQLNASRPILMDIYACLHPGDRAYFRETREKRFGKRLEEVCPDPQAELPAFRLLLEPARRVLAKQAYLAGAAPNYADYALYGTFMWWRMTSRLAPFERDDAMFAWLARMDETCDGEGARALAAAGMLHAGQPSG